ncbi:hypothetical protein OHA84_36010 [Streptomyces sp. NBC_00513]|uniref:hypothetical protein n=1 Tax=unclassified Streptomyces TaxID=2593676 RepID=UPI002255909F|nr:hypothetical protein [Streptomyces sp. NBC_00424]MCX5071091.1 hypothetical protein [Streptomyces sp. NBC_00424]WUD45485.1 hypothetical protein OHA84_36010 [Streptomyces sp. NBC_00513]
MPQADVTFPGAVGNLLSGRHGQVVFWTFDQGGEVPPHAHGPQLGVVLTGGIRMSRGGTEVEYRAGQWFDLADGETHAAHIRPGTLVIEVFEEADRHRERTAN